MGSVKGFFPRDFDAEAAFSEQAKDLTAAFAESAKSTKKAPSNNPVE